MQSNADNWHLVRSALAANDVSIVDIASEAETTTTTTIRTTTSSPYYQKRLSISDKEQLAAIHAKIQSKWTLQSSHVVEDILHNVSRNCEHEQDGIYRNPFTAKEKQEIVSNFTAHLFNTPWQPRLKSIIEHLNGELTYRRIYDDPLDDDLCWLRESILDYAALFMKDSKLSGFRTEQDPLDDV